MRGLGVLEVPLNGDENADLILEKIVLRLVGADCELKSLGKTFTFMFCQFTSLVTLVFSVGEWGEVGDFWDWLDSVTRAFTGTKRKLMYVCLLHKSVTSS